jgi:hypothetical protein
MIILAVRIVVLAVSAAYFVGAVRYIYKASR